MEKLQSAVIRTAHDLWLKGWAERNAGNLSVRLRPEEVEEGFSDSMARGEPLETAIPELGGEYFLFTNTGSHMRLVELDLLREHQCHRARRGRRVLSRRPRRREEEPDQRTHAPSARAHRPQTSFGERGPRRHPYSSCQPDRLDLRPGTRHRFPHPPALGNAHRVHRRLSQGLRLRGMAVARQRGSGKSHGTDHGTPQSRALAVPRHRGGGPQPRRGLRPDRDGRKGGGDLPQGGRTGTGGTQARQRAARPRSRAALASSRTRRSWRAGIRSSQHRLRHSRISSRSRPTGCVARGWRGLPPDWQRHRGRRPGSARCRVQWLPAGRCGPLGRSGPPVCRGEAPSGRPLRRW